MRIDLNKQGVWERLNDQVGLVLAVPEQYTVRCYTGLAAAVYEVTTGLNQFFSHKKDLALTHGLGPSFDFLMPHLYRENYQLQSLPCPTSELEFANWVSGLKADTNYAMVEMDHPVTGQINFSESQAELIAQRKIFSVQVYHSLWRRWALAKTWNLLPMQVAILSVNEHLAIVIAGSRFKALPLVASQMAWRPEAVLQAIQYILQEHREQQAVIQKFESELTAGWLPMVSSDLRIWDRACIYHPEASGDAVRTEMLKALASLKVDFSEKLVTTDLCFWQQAPSFYNWWKAATDPQMLRSGLILSLDFVARGSVQKLIEQATEKAVWR